MSGFLDISGILDQVPSLRQVWTKFISAELSLFISHVLLIVTIVAISNYIYRSFVFGTKEKRNEEERVREKANELFMNAQREASTIIQTASLKAREILGTAGVVKDEVLQTTTREILAISEQHKRYLKDASLKYVETYEHMAEEAQEEYLHTLHAASQAMAKDAQQSLGMFETFLKEQTIGYKLAMEKKIDQLRMEANTSIDEYRKEKLKRVDKSINEIILMVAKHVIGRSINLKEHNELVIRALEEAKKEGFFSHLSI